MAGKKGVVLAAVLLLAGCGVTDQFRQENDDLGKKTAADFNAVPGTVDAYTSISMGSTKDSMSTS